MKIGHVDIDRDVLVVAEIGNNHEGDLGLAEDLISLAAGVGAQAVKFQTILPSELVAPDQEARLAQLRRICIPAEAHERLALRAKKEGVMFISTPFYLGAVDLLEPLAPAFKIASGDNNFVPLLRQVGATGKPILLSTGMADITTVTASVRVLEGLYQDRGQVLPLVLMHCVSAYPTPVDQANLKAIATLATLGYRVGYSDHTLGTQACVMAVALGARVLEKHFTISKTHSEFRDHQLSADPKEMQELVERVREANVLLGDGEKRIMKDEQAVAAKRSIAAACDLPAGHRLIDSDLAWLRPADGLAPGNESLLLGRALRSAVKAGERLTLDKLKD
jgi:N,N'-diacetyllegionaminate synthase